MDMTLREMCDALDVKRRAVQGYEKIGLVTPTKRTDRGYLLYDDAARARIEKIKMYQDFGFSVKEIKEVIDASEDIRKKALENKLQKLKEERTKQDVLISKAQNILKTL